MRKATALTANILFLSFLAFTILPSCKEDLTSIQHNIEEKNQRLELSKKELKHFQTETDRLIADAYALGKKNKLFAKKKKLDTITNFYTNYHLDDRQTAYAARHLGNIYTRIGEFEEAEKCLKYSFDTYKTLKDTSGMLKSNSDLGLMKRFAGNKQEAWRIFQDILALSPNHSLAKVNLGQLAIEFKKYKEGIEILNSIDPERKTPGFKIGVFKYLGIGHAQLGKIEASRNNFKKAIGVSNASPRDSAIAHFEYGKSYFLKIDNPKAALDQFQKALTILIPAFQPKNDLDNPDDHTLIAEFTILDILLEKAKIMETWHHETSDIDYLKKALDNHRQIAKVEDLLRVYYGNSESKLNLLDENHARREAAINICHLLYQQTGDTKYINNALQFSENSRFVLLEESLNKLRAQSEGILPADTLRQLQRLEEGIALLTIEKKDLESRKPADAYHLQTIANDINTLEQQRTVLTNQIRNDHPGFFEERNLRNIITLEDAQAYANRDNRTLIEYFLGNDRSYAIVINNQSADLTCLDLTQSDIDQVTNFVEVITQKGDLGQYKDLGQTLYNHLIKPLDQFNWTPKATIFPDGMLSLIPFDALLTTAPTGNDARAYPYLFKDHQLSTGFSLGTLLMESPAAPTAATPYLGIAPERFRQKGLTSISGSQNFVKIGKTLFGDRAKVLCGGQASKSAFKQWAPTANILLIYTHANAYDPIQQKPCIAFADSYLFMNELYTLHLSADLVILNACETGTGAVRNGEGPMTLARAFAYAGCPSILTTLWSVNNKANTQITEAYLRGINQQLDKDEALYQAKQQYLSNTSKTKGHPYFWSGLMQVGNLEAIEGL